MSDDLSFIDEMIGEMENDTSKQGNGDLKVINLFEKGISNRSFTMRIVLDKNKCLYNQFLTYNVQLEVPKEDGSGEIIKRWIRYRPSMKRDEDPIYPYAKELNNFMYSATYNNSFYGEIVEVTEGKTEKFYPSPCILIVNNQRFLKALKSCMAAIYKKKNGADENFGRRLLAEALDPTKKGHLFNITASKGQSGAVSIQFTPFGDPDHEFKPEIATQFEDIKKAACPQFDADNEKNSLLIIDHYKGLLSSRSNHVEPDEKELAEQAESDKKRAEREKSDQDVVDNLYNALDAAGIPNVD